MGGLKGTSAFLLCTQIIFFVKAINYQEYLIYRCKELLVTNPIIYIRKYGVESELGAMYSK